MSKHYPGETLSSIYNGIPRHIDPRPVSEPSLPSASQSQEVASSSTALLQAPYHPNEDVISEARETVSKPDSAKGKKNYKGQAVDGSVKVRVVRPRIVDTSAIVKWDTSIKNVFANPKKVESNITIKLIPRSDNQSKRIVIKDPRCDFHRMLFQVFYRSRLSLICYVSACRNW